jgi:2-oxoglutarate dehydrogenase E2 component (dihydrolipoamide succinyltransferase)
MTVQIKAPALGESITEATVAVWNKKEGDFVEADELIAELETDKVNLEVIAPSAGKITAIKAGEGATVEAGDIMGEIDESAKGEAGKSADASAEDSAPKAQEKQAESNQDLSPAVRKMVAEKNVDPSQVQGSGKDGRLTKGDVMNHLEKGASAPKSAPAATRDVQEQEVRTPMSRLRKTIATRLKHAQNTAAMLTTYNEVDLKAVGELRNEYKQKFMDAHGAKLGYMSFFTKAVVEALKDWPQLNSSIDGEDIVQKNYYDIGIAVGSERGLVVPVLRNADELSFAEIEQKISDFGQRARANKLSPDELTGGTFTITNGGVFGSMLSMPILNYPQSAILGMHAIKDRPVVVDGEIVIRPMMYLALTYDHRLVDGREAVSFLVKIKDCLENPSRMLLGV